MIRNPALFAPGYQNAHRRCRRLWGKASAYPCCACGQKARDWAYDGTDRSSAENYSRYPEYYMPMCVRCHVNYDRHWHDKVRIAAQPEPKPVVIPKNPRTEAEWKLWTEARR